MSEKIAMELSPYMSPDSLRKTTQMLKNLYDNHTKKYCGYEDMNGSQYVGTVENFGSELLLESRKIFLDRSSLKNILIKNTFDYYFDIQYSEIINSYEQENMLCAILRKDVLLSNKEYRIKFNNVEKVYIIRSESWGDTITHVDPYIKTTTPPSLIIKNKDGTIEEFELKISDKSDVDTDYYFHLGSDTENLYEEYNSGDTVFMTKPITDRMNGLPLIWICVNDLRTRSRIVFHNNGTGSKPLLTIGSNGNNESYIYPYMYAEDSFDGYASSGWIISAIADDTDGFVENDNSELNYNTKLKEIRFDFYRYSGGLRDPDFTDKPLASFTTTWDDNMFIKLTLVNDSRFNWKFRKSSENDYYYDGITYNNKCYAYTHLNYFINNYPSAYLPQYGCLAAFKIQFDDSFVHKYETVSGNAVSGLHIDVTSDYSNNGVSKKNGTIHNLGDFDGLPKYFKYMIDDTIHRAHAELYSIRDDINGINQKSVDKQTAGLIIDSSIPQTETQKSTANMEIYINYNQNDQTQYLYDTRNDVLTSTNVLSEIVYVDDNTMSNYRISKYKNNNKFIYHGNRFFSLDIIGFNPELEMGRVYVISNDKAIYENNATTKNRKPDRTFARICDIPTEFSQLINIENHAPTLIIDKKYVRTETDFNEYEKNILWNKTNSIHYLFFKNEKSGIMTIIFPSLIDIKDIVSKNYLNDNFREYYNLNQKIDLNDESVCQISIGQSGKGYSIDDKFSFSIGGICVEGYVCDVGDDGEVIDININYITEPVNLSNFSNRYSFYDTNTIDGVGEGLTIIIDINKDFWNSRMIQKDSLYDDIFTFKFDYNNNIWVWEFINDTWIKTTQITGLPEEHNIYDASLSYSLIESLLYYIISNHNKSLMTDNVLIDISVSNIPKTIDIDEHDDLSSYIDKLHINNQDCFYVIEDNNDISENYYAIKSFKRYGDNDDHNLIIPSGHKLNVSSYINKTNGIFYHLNNNNQPILFMYNPLTNIKNDSFVICKDINSVKNNKNISISDIIQDNRIITDSGYILKDIYAYEEFPFIEIEKIRKEFDDMSDDDLIGYIMKNHNHTIATKYINTKYSYTHEMLVNYIMTNNLYMLSKDNTDEAIYARQNIKLQYKKDTKISDYDYYIGDYKPISTTMFNSKGFINQNNIEFKPLFVFKLDGDYGSLKNFRMKDDMDNDISDMTLLIYNNELRICINESDGSCKWVKIKR